MSIPSYYNKSYRYLDATVDFTGDEDDQEDTRNGLPPPAHSSSQASLIPLSASQHSSRKLPIDVSIIPVGINYSSDSVNIPRNTTDFRTEYKTSEIPITICPVTGMVNDKKIYSESNSRRYQQISPPSNIYLGSSSISQMSTHSILSSASSFSSTHYGSSNLGFTTTTPKRHSPVLVYSNNAKNAPSNSFASLPGMPTDLAMWDTMSRRISSPQNTRPSMSPTFSTPQISSQPFSFSPLPGLLPPFNTSLIPIPPSSHLGSGIPTTISIGFAAPSSAAILKHSSSSNNNCNVLDSNIQGSALSSLFSNLSSNTSSPSNSRSVTPTNSSMHQGSIPLNTFVVPGYNVSYSKSNPGNALRSPGKASSTMVPEIISIVTEEIMNDAISNRKDMSSNASETGGVEGQSKYNQLLAVLQDMEKDIRPSYAGSKSSTERLKRGIVHSRILIREALADIEKGLHRSNSEERQIGAKHPKLD